MGQYAKQTSVPVERTKGEIERLMTRYGASAFMSGARPGEAVLAFEINDRRVMFQLPLPLIEDEQFRYTPSRRKERSSEARFEAWEQACRQRWRALLLVIKAKLEAVDVGITTFEDEFLAHIVMPDGMRVSDHVRPRIQAAYDTGDMPPLIPDFSGDRK